MFHMISPLFRVWCDVRVGPSYTTLLYMAFPYMAFKATNVLSILLNPPHFGPTLAEWREEYHG